jgi:hypothetical protein
VKKEGASRIPRSAPWNELSTMQDRGTTLFEYGAGQLRRLQSALRIDPKEQIRLLKVYEDLTRSWGHRRISETPPWSALTDDCSPFEFSVAISKTGPELRMIVEAQSELASPSGYWGASMELSRHLEKVWVADLDRLKKVESLFEPNHDVWFVAAHGTVMWPTARPSFKIYLNPAARGPSLAPNLVEKALSCIGLLPSWVSLKRHLQDGGTLHCLSLDLTSGVDACVKVYVRFPAPTLDRLSRVLEAVDPDLARHINGFAAAVFGRSLNQLPRPALVAYNLRPGSCEPGRLICQLASFPFAGTDLEVSDRVARFMDHSGLEAQPYRQAVRAMSEGLDHCDKGIHNYVSLQRDEAALRVTIYLCPRVYLERYGAIGYDPRVAWPSPVNQGS